MQKKSAYKLKRERSAPFVPYAIGGVRVLQRQESRNLRLLVETPPQRRIVVFKGQKAPFDIPFPWMYYVVNQPVYGMPYIPAIYASGKQRTYQGSPGYRSVVPFFFFNQYGWSPCYGDDAQEEYFDRSVDNTTDADILNTGLSIYWAERFNTDGTYYASPFWERLVRRMKMRNRELVTTKASIHTHESGLQYSFASGKVARSVLARMERLSIDDMLELYADTRGIDKLDLRNIL